MVRSGASAAAVRSVEIASSAPPCCRLAGGAGRDHSGQQPRQPLDGRCEPAGGEPSQQGCQQSGDHFGGQDAVTHRSRRRKGRSRILLLRARLDLQHVADVALGEQDDTSVGGHRQCRECHRQSHAKAQAQSFAMSGRKSGRDVAITTRILTLGGTIAVRTGQVARQVMDPR